MTQLVKRYNQIGGTMADTYKVVNGVAVYTGGWVRAEDYDAATAWTRLPLDKLANEHAALHQYLSELERIITRMQYAASGAGI